MRVYRGYRELEIDAERPAVTIGNFDGVHLGHQKVMRATVAGAVRRGVPSVACTFDPHTLEVLRPEAAPPRLQTLEQKLDSIAELGLDATVVIPFDRGVAATPPEEFVDEFLLGRLRVGSLHLSRGFSFGRDQAGNRRYLERRAAESGFEVERVSPEIVDGSPVSSTRIRRLLGQGAVPEASALLGCPFVLRGTVVEGRGLGRRLDARTANLDHGDRCIPGHGVYLTEARLIEERAVRPSITNVGTRPTFGERSGPVVETHLLDFDGPSLYGSTIDLAFLERLRAERRFDSPEELRRQIRDDIERARAFFEHRSRGAERA